MTRPPDPLPGSRRPARRMLAAVLAALAAAACDGDPAGPAQQLPADDMRLSALVLADTQLGAISRHDFMYDDAGRLRRVEYRISEVRDGPPVSLTRYIEHAYENGRLARTDFFGLRADGGGFASYARITYTHDARGRLAAELTELATLAGDVATGTVTFAYDSRDRLSSLTESHHNEVSRFAYAGSGSLASAEARYGDGTVLRSTYQHDTGRNPFYGKTALVNSLIIPLHLWPMLLSPHNMLRQENRVNSDPTLVSSVTHEYTYDGEGRPLHLRQVFRNDVEPTSMGTFLFFDFEYEPVPGG